MYEVVSSHDRRVGVLRDSLLEARLLAEPGDVIYLLGDGPALPRVGVVGNEPRPGERVIDGQVFYSARWL